MRVLFSVRNPWYVRHYETVLRRLAAAGHTVDLVADGLGRAPVWPPHVERLVRECPAITLHWTPAPAGQPWYEFGTRLRQALYFLRFLRPSYAEMPALLARTEVKAPPLAVRLARGPVVGSAAGRRLLEAAIAWLERVVPPSPEIGSFLERLAPDVVVLTPLIVLRTVQIDLLRSAAASGVPTAFAVASWDHLSSKGLLWSIPARVIVWNATQRREAVALHGVPEDRVRITGAQLFDQWFDRRPARSRDEFCREVGLDPARAYILYVGSALFEHSPNEAEFARRWIGELRRSPHAAVRGAAILIRPHPRRAAEWEAVDFSECPDVVVHPRAGESPVDEASRDTYFESMAYAAAVVGVNTSAMVEAAILERPVLTILLPEFRSNQEGTVHFRYLLDPADGLLEVARTFPAHTDQLNAALGADQASSAARSRQFVETFIRPLGIDTEATSRVVAEIEDTARLSPAPPSPAPLTGLIRRLLYPLAVRTARAVTADRAAAKAAKRRPRSG